MKQIFKNHITTNFPSLKDTKLLLTVSGGIDSVVLTHLLHKLGYDIAIAHCNFCLRGEDANVDQQFVKNLAKQLHVPFFTTKFDTQNFAISQKISIQEAARNLRYTWFYEIIKEQKLDVIITAHNLNDSLETFLINLSRGTGLKGLIGIPSTNQSVVRPLLPFSRKEIHTFAMQQNILWREDKSNANTKYTRNKIRHTIIPVLEEINPNLLQSFSQTLKNLKDSAHIVDNTIEKFKENSEIINPQTKTIKFKISDFQKLANPKAYIHEVFKKYQFTNFRDIASLLTAQSGKQVFSKTHRLLKDRDYLLLSEINNKKEKNKVQINASDSNFTIENKTYHIQLEKSVSQQDNTIQFDKDLLKFPLIVRKWQKGDYFYPIGMQGKKKLSKYFKDEKLSLLEKENIWLLLSDNKIVWIINKRQDQRFKVTPKTKKILTITK